MDFDNEYFWVVLCKNNFFHYRQNRSSGHKILLGETDAVLPPPRLEASFTAACDDCGKEYDYKLSDVLRYQTERPESFVAHPLFNDSDNL